MGKCAYDKIQADWKDHTTGILGAQCLCLSLPLSTSPHPREPSRLQVWSQRLTPRWAKDAAPLSRRHEGKFSCPIAVTRLQGCYTATDFIFVPWAEHVWAHSETEMGITDLCQWRGGDLSAQKWSNLWLYLSPPSLPKSNTLIRSIMYSIPFLTVYKRSLIHFLPIFNISDEFCLCLLSCVLPHCLHA